MGKYVQYGCGWSSPPGWENYDASPTLRFERIPLIGHLYTKNASRFPANVKYGDIVRGLPITRESCSGVYASHVLEHLSLKDFRIALKNTYNLLEPGGVFRLVVPDLQILAKEYLSSSSATASYDFMLDLGMGFEERPRGLVSLLKSYLGNSAHLWMWDFKAIVSELESAKYSEIRRCTLNDASDPKFFEVEDATRFLNALAVEARKPL